MSFTVDKNSPRPAPSEAEDSRSPLPWTGIPSAARHTEPNVPVAFCRGQGCPSATHHAEPNMPVVFCREQECLAPRPARSRSVLSPSEVSSQQHHTQERKQQHMQTRSQHRRQHQTQHNNDCHRQDQQHCAKGMGHNARSRVPKLFQKPIPNSRIQNVMANSGIQKACPPQVRPWHFRTILGFHG